MDFSWASDVSVLVLVILFFVAAAAGFIDSIAGGGGLITIPVMLAAGLPAAETLATNKLQAVGGSFSASLYFVRKKAVDLKKNIWLIATTFVGSGCGAALIQQLPSDMLKQMLPILVIIIGVYFLLAPKLGEQERPQRISLFLMGFVTGMIGFYDGFFGPGTGSFLALAFVGFMGFTLVRATAHAKVMNFASNFGSLIVFAFGGHLVWHVGLVMLCGQILGARLGAGLVLTHGQRIIRPMLVIVSFTISAKLLYDQYGPLVVGN